LLRVRLRYLDEMNEEKERICKEYLEKIRNPYITLPQILKGASHVWHQFVIRTPYRDELIEYLNEKEIATIIHYPVPPHLQKAYRYLNVDRSSLTITEQYAKEVLSIPLYNGMTEEEQDYVIDALNGFKR